MKNFSLLFKNYNLSKSIYNSSLEDIGNLLSKISSTNAGDINTAFILILELNDGTIII